MQTTTKMERSRLKRSRLSMLGIITQLRIITDLRLRLRLWPGRRLEHSEGMSTRLHGTGRKLRALPIWKVRQAANLLAKD
jgi:hypothetical protein